MNEGKGVEDMFPTKTRILIVDDMTSIQEMLKKALVGMGYTQITVAGNGEEALKKLLKAEQTNQPIELIISDWNMPKMKGIELLKEVRGSDLWKNVPFLMLTSESEREVVTEAILAGVDQYVVKPFSPKMISEKLDSVWARRNKAAS